MGKKLSFIVLGLFLASLLAGCAGMERRVGDRKYYCYPSALVQADKALMEAQASGKDKECPAEFNALKAKVDEIYDVYHSCRTEESIVMANDATKNIRALCPAKPVVQAPAPPPPAPKPQPAPPPPPAAKPEAKRVLEKITLHANFDFDKSAIRRTDEAELNRAIDFVKKYPDAEFRLEGHTDSIGTETYNQKLSERRAEAVKHYLVSKGGFDKARFTTIGYGKTKPVASNKTKEGRAQNRRVEVLALSE